MVTGVQVYNVLMKWALKKVAMVVLKFMLLGEPVSFTNIADLSAKTAKKTDSLELNILSLQKKMLPCFIKAENVKIWVCRLPNRWILAILV